MKKIILGVLVMLALTGLIASCEPGKKPDAAAGDTATTTEAVTEPPEPFVLPDDLGLKDYVAIIRPDFRIGTYYFLDAEWHSPKIIEHAKKNYDTATLGIFMHETQPSRASWSLTRLNSRLSTVKRHGMDVCFHLLNGWNTYSPAWFKDGSFTEEELEEILDNRIKTIMEKYKDDIWAVHVINEAFEWGGGLYPAARNKWINMGMTRLDSGYSIPKYIELSFIKAREYGGDDILLVYNDDGNSLPETNRGRSTLRLIREMKGAGIPVDAVGVQLHMYLRADGKIYEEQGIVFDYAKFDAMITAYGELGVEVHITEFEVKLPANPTEEQYEKQAETYRRVLETCINNPYCTLFQVWYISDNYSPGDTKSGPFDKSNDPKPAYYAMRDLLKEMAEDVLNG